MNESRNVAIVGYGETKITLRGGRSAYELAADVFDEILRQTSFDRSEFDGLAVAETMSETANPFWPAYMADMLGVTPTWLECLALGGVLSVGGVARAIAAIEAGFCSTVLVLSTDSQSSKNQSEQGGQRHEFQYPIGLKGPVGAFGLLTRRYQHLHQLDPVALAKLAVTQRKHALLNPNACDKLKVPLSEQDYLASRFVSDPVRILESVMVCDGANGILLTTKKNIRSKGIAKFVVPTAYAEITNFEAFNPAAEITETGFKVAGPKALTSARLKTRDVCISHPYDDFLITTPLAHRIAFARMENLLVLGATLVVLPKFEPMELSSTLRERSITVLGVVPTAARLLLPEIERAPEDFRNLKRVLATGEAFPVELEARFLAALPGVSLFSFYSMTEAGVVERLSRKITADYRIRLSRRGWRPWASIRRDRRRKSCGICRSTRPWSGKRSSRRPTSGSNGRVACRTVAGTPATGPIHAHFAAPTFT